MTDYLDHLPLLAWFDQRSLFGISIGSLIIAVTAAVLAYLAMTVLLHFAMSRVRKMADRLPGEQHPTTAVVLDLLSGTHRGLIALAALLIGLGMLDLSDRWAMRVGQLWFVAVALQLGLWGTRAITIGLQRYVQRHSSATMTQVGASTVLMSWGLRTVLWAVVMLAMLSNLGVNITAFVASLGVGGIAIALAVQNILGDLFASLSIAVDKPFEAGDFISVNGVTGTVQMIGLKTTRIRSLSGEQVVMSNTNMLKQTINNFRYLQERRIVFKFGVTYAATPEQLEAISPLVKRIIDSEEKLRFDRGHFAAFGENALEFEVVYIVLDPSYGVYMDLQQKINLALMRALREMGLGFSLPGRMLYLAPGALPESLMERRPPPAGPMTVGGDARIDAMSDMGDMGGGRGDPRAGGRADDGGIDRGCPPAGAPLQA